VVVPEPVVGFPAGPDQQPLQTSEETPQSGQSQVAQAAREGVKQVTQLSAQPAEQVRDQLLLADDHADCVEHDHERDKVAQVHLEHNTPLIVVLKV